MRSHLREISEQVPFLKNRRKKKQQQLVAIRFTLCLEELSRFRFAQLNNGPAVKRNNTQHSGMKREGENKTPELQIFPFQKRKSSTLVAMILFVVS